MIVNTENEIGQLYDENFNQKVLVNGGVSVYFWNVFLSSNDGKLPMIKNKLRQILVDYGLCQTCIEIDQKLNFIKVWYRDPKAIELKELYVPLRRDNNTKESQAIELVISLEGSMCSPPKISRGIKSYTGLTKLLFQDFISESRSYSLADDNPFNEMKIIIQKGNLAACVPLESIFSEGVD